MIQFWGVAYGCMVKLCRCTNTSANRFGGVVPSPGWSTLAAHWWLFIALGGFAGFGIAVLRKPETCLRSSELVSPSCHWCGAKHDGRWTSKPKTGYWPPFDMVFKSWKCMFVWKMRWCAKTIAHDMRFVFGICRKERWFCAPHQTPPNHVKRKIRRRSKTTTFRVQNNIQNIQ